MKKNNLLLSILFIFLFLISPSLKGQNNVTSRIRVVSGGTISFYFNSLSKYKSGLTLTDWTRLNVYFNDTTIGNVGSGNGWQLLVRADDIGVIADGGAPALALSSIILTASASGGFTGTLAPPVTLSNADQLLVSDATNVSVNEEIVISYEIGTTNNPPNSPYLGKPADYYSVNLVFTLEPLP